MAWPWHTGNTSDQTISHSRSNNGIGTLDMGSDLTDLLTSQVYAVGEVALQYDAELRELQHEVASAPAELAIFTEENAVLASRAQEGLEEAAALSSAQTKLATEADTCRQKVIDLESERDVLRARVATAEQLLASAQSATDWASRAYDVERSKGEEWDRNFESEIESRSCRGANEEGAAAEESRKISRLEARLAASRAEIATVKSSSATEAERRRQQAVGLEETVGETLSRQRAYVAREHQLSEDLGKAKKEGVKLERSMEVLSVELRDSEQSGEQTELKALGVARELLETSQSIARLRVELAGQQELRQELESAHRQEGALQQRLLEAETAAASLLPRRNLEAHQVLDTSLVGHNAGKHVSSTPSRCKQGTSQELVDTRAAQERALNDALRAAWEAEARDRRDAQLRIEAAEATLLPLREWLVHLSSAARRGCDDLLPPRDNEVAARQHELLKRAAGLGCKATDPAQCSHIPDALATLCDCIEDLAGESLRRLAAAQTTVARAGSVAVPRALSPHVRFNGDCIAEVSSLSASSPALSHGYRSAS